jgi:hypothetical protein
MRSAKIICSILLLIAVVSFEPSHINVWARSRSENRREQEIKALRLLGKPGKGKMKNTCSSLSAGLGTQGIIRKWLEEKDYATQLHDIAKKLAKEGADCSVQSLYFPIEQLKPIDAIQELLGKEDGRKSGQVTLSDETRQLTWYEYGWLSFGVEDGKVTVVQIDFKQSGF